MPVSYTCGCGLHVHPSRVNPDAVHIADCEYGRRLHLARHPSRGTGTGHLCPTQSRYACAWNRLFCADHSTLAERVEYLLDGIRWDGYEKELDSEAPRP